MLKFLNPLYFFISFAVGLFIVYVFNPPPQVVVKFPSPYNSEKIIYKDKNDSCYKYKSENVTCPTDRTLIRPQPLFDE